MLKFQKDYGSKCDRGNIQKIFSLDSKIAVAAPVYPVYLDSNIMAGRTKIIYLPRTAENNFAPAPPNEKVELIYQLRNSVRFRLRRLYH